ncbi:MAG TPA: TetR/AcrR family transcriptional regulator [Caulobacteraceae bacterium]|jgi:AcrR family transcriptional regulator|nr:TetR/AcrR family transcriptional regulator [Caulobacteraceae bacterium]
MALVREGEVAPGAEQVAERAEVGLRTVFRHFNDMDSLYREMSHVTSAELRKVILRPFKGQTWQERILELVERRTPAYEQIAPLRRAADAHRHGSAFLSSHQQVMVLEGREILKRELPPAWVTDPVKFELLDMLLSYEAWNRLRRDQGLSVRKAREVLEAAVRRVLEEQGS